MKKEEIDNVNTDETEKVAAEAPETSENQKPETPEPECDPLEVALEENEKLKKELLYKIAEFDNYRKRTMQEKADLILNGGQKTVAQILPVLDDMERAIDNAPKTEDIKALEEGWELIAKKLWKTLESMGVKKMDVADSDFDTDFHEAIAMVPGMGEEKKNKVIDCVQAGYTMNDKVIRHAKVAVGA